MTAEEYFELKKLLLAATGASFLGSLGLNYFLKNRLKKIKNIKQKDLAEIYKHVGIPTSMPTFEVEGLENAYYASPGKPTSEVKDVAKRNEALLKKIKELGLVAYDPKFAKPGILAHEAGHAAIRLNNKWYHPSRLNQSILRPISSIVLPFAGGFALSNGLDVNDPIIGGLTGLGIGGLAGLPTIVNEMQATHYAKKYLNNSKLSPNEIKKNKKALNAALGTYLVGGLAYPTLAGAIGGGFHSLNN